MNWEEPVGLFDSKAKRVVQHRQLLDLAKATLENLKVEVYKSSNQVTRPVWTETTNAMLPLEYRWWVIPCLETLVCAVHDTEDSELGQRDWIRELSESLNTVRSISAGLPETVRNTFRADCFARLQAALDNAIGEVARLLATDGVVALWSGTLEGLLGSAKEALTWFQKQEDLDAASALRRAPDKKLPKPYLSELERLVQDGAATLAKVREHERARKSVNQ